MKKQELIDLGVAADVADSILVLHGKDVESNKKKATDLQAKFDATNQQLTDANKQIEDFKGMDVEAVKKAAMDWETKFKEAEQTAATKLQELQFSHALESALSGAKAKNPKTVQALLNREGLKLKDDGTIEGLDTQLESIKKDNGFLFSDGTEPPRIVTGTKSQSVLGNAFVNAARKGAKLPETQ